MKKYGIISYSKDFPNFLDSLQDFGLVDITQTLCNLEGEEKKILNWLNFCNEAIHRLECYKAEKQYETHSIRDSRKATYILKEYQKDAAEYEQVNEEIKQRDKLYRELLPWGNYDPEIVEKLKKNGLELLFFTCDKRNFDPKWNEDYDLEIVNEEKGLYYFVIAKPIHEKIVIAANEVKMPEVSLNTQMEEVDVLKVRRAALNKSFKEMIPYLPTLYEERTRLQNALSFDRIVTCTESLHDDTVRVVQGFIPEEKEAALLEFLDAHPVYYTAMNIEKGDNVPILLKNNRFAKLFEPITKIFSLPNYGELDITPFFAPFFMMFVGFCTGDAGYGLLLLLGGFLVKRKLSAALRPIVSLAQWFGVAAIIFGLLGGTFFGVELVEVPALARIKHYFFDQDKMMIMAFALGGVQILFGMMVSIANIIKKRGFKFAIARMGWVVLILALLGAYGLPMIGVAIPQPLMYVFYGIFALSGVAIFFFNSPGTHPAVQVGLGAWDAFNMATGVLGDFLSYVRLFALGLTGGILGGVFNKLAFDMSPDIPFVGILVTLLILLVGHSLNLLLTLIGAFVHPLRLTFVEFYKNAQFEGGGREYKPFEKIKNK
ncbi:MAG: V-type ATP synthase subunit I [Bacteroidales bacterium]|nr:V-type ATP synthase subunit I [Bacteroidales bacterium]